MAISGYNTLMIKYFSRSKKNNKTIELKGFKNNCWIHVVDPTESELELLKTTYKLDPGHLRDGLDMYEVPRLERENGTLYIFTRYPLGDTESIVTAPILIVMADKFLVTMSPMTAKFLDRFRNIEPDYTTDDKIRLLLYILLYTSRAYNYFLNRISKQIQAIEIKLERIHNRDIIRFVAFEGIVGDFRPALLRNNTVLEDFLKIRSLQLSQPESELAEDVVLLNKQLIEIADDNLRTIVNVRDAYTTIMTNNLNRVIKLFTTLTVLLTVPSVTFGIYSMNIALPFQHEPWVFWAMNGITLGLCLLMLWIFVKKDYL